jgi:hypothetical protein
VDVRDRAMLLTSTSVAFRGDSSRSLLWSDQFLFEVPILAKGLDAKIPVHISLQHITEPFRFTNTLTIGSYINR